jgi:hypothetical protein
MDKPVGHVLWDSFVVWASRKEIPLMDDKWVPWWECFMAGGAAERDGIRHDLAKAAARRRR